MNEEKELYAWRVSVAGRNANPVFYISAADMFEAMDKARAVILDFVNHRPPDSYIINFVPNKIQIVQEGIYREADIRESVKRIGKS